jgi:hypothetical protein
MSAPPATTSRPASSVRRPIISLRPISTVPTTSSGRNGSSSSVSAIRIDMSGGDPMKMAAREGPA